MIETRLNSRETTPFFEYLNKLRDTIDTAEDKDAVKEAIRSRLYGAQTMRGSEENHPTSSKDEELRDIFRDIENEEDDDDGEMLGKLNEALFPQGGRRRKTKKSARKTKKVKKAVRKTRKSQKYSRRR